MSEPTNGSPGIPRPEAVPGHARSTDLPSDAPWWAKLLVPDIRQCWRWLTTYAVALAAGAPIAFEYLPQVRQYLSDSTFHYVETLLVILIFLGRIKRQKGDSP